MFDFLITVIIWGILLYLVIFIARHIVAYATDRPLPKSVFVETLANIFLIFFIANFISNLFERDD